jgi:PST family polysaccharide transporter
VFRGSPSDRSPGSARDRQASIVARAARGAFWTILSGAGGRAMGILGTLAITHYLRPHEYGEASIAALVTMAASSASNLGVAQYVAGKPHADRAAVFHATFYYLVVGALALAASVFVGASFGGAIGAPGIGKYLPLLAASAFLDRVCVLMDRIQLRDMHFRTVGLLRSLGELVYAVTAVALAATCGGTIFGGAFALAWAMLARSLVRLVALWVITPWRTWAEPHPITAARTRELFAFGVPMSLAGVASFGSTRFDNFVYSHHFGESAVGKYNLAYNFAEIPAALIAESVGDVLLPSFAHMEDRASRRDAFLLALRTVALLVTPLALGLGAVAPDLVGLAFPPEYESVAGALYILVLVSIPRTIIWTAISYLQVRNDTRVIMVVETFRMVGIVVFMQLTTQAVAHLFGPDAAKLAACASVVGVFALSALGYMVAIERLDGVSLGAQVRPLIPPLIASLPMVLVVVLVQRALGHVAWAGALSSFGARARVFGPRLALEVAAGAMAFVPSALALAPTASRQLLRLARDAVVTRRGVRPAEAA